METPKLAPEHVDRTRVEVPRRDSILERLKERPITLLDKDVKLTMENTMALAPGQTVVICDAPVEGVDEGEPSHFGHWRDNVLNIDHHGKGFGRQISSTNLAISFVKRFRPIVDELLCVTHTDCDSVLSSAIMRGLIPADEELFGKAAIAADHTGKANPIADLLQALDEKRDLEFSLRNLEAYLEGRSIDPEAQEMLDKRLLDRERARIIADGFKSNASGRIHYAYIDKKIDAGFLPGLLPEAALIVVFNPLIDKATKQAIPGVLEAKVRLGNAAPADLDLPKIMKAVDSNFGGRWNAGSNGRYGGTELDPETYIKAIESIMGA